MTNDKDAPTAEHRYEAMNGDTGYTASPSSPSRLVDFEFKDCKTEPGTDSDNEILSEDRSSTNSLRLLQIPKLEPIVLLERCDKIWETLQLIRNMQCESPTTASEDENEADEEEEEEEKEEEEEEEEEAVEEKKNNKKITLPNKTEQTLSMKRQHKLTNDGKTPFQFSVQKTRRLYPCVTCGKQYMEKRSLRKHALRIHGIIIPVRHRRSLKSRTTNMHNSNENDTTTLLNEGNSNLERFYKNKHLQGKMTAYNHLKKSNVSSVDSNDESKSVSTEPFPKSYNRCALCRQKVKCVKSHLINYHKIGCSANMLKQLETSLVINSGSSSGSNKPTLRDILSGKPPEASVYRDTQNKSHVMGDENKSRETPQIPQKRKYTLSSYMSNKKKFKLNNGHYVSVQNASKLVQGYIPLKKRYKCDICLGIYSSANTLAKHRRIHASRGETKENFHNFECKYFNSPLSKRYQQLISSAKSNDITAKNVNNGLTRNAQSSVTNMSPSQMLRTSKIGHAATYDADKEDNTCLCGRSFRTSYIMRIHKDNCKFSAQNDKMAQNSTRDEYSSDRDSGIGINITIKKRNNSYEIVGKDGDEDKQSDHITDRPPSSNASHGAVKDATDVAGQRQIDENETSKYSKDHSVLKLRKEADEDLIIDVEDDVQLHSQRKVEQETVVQRSDKEETRRDGAAANAKEDPTLDNVLTLKQICQEVLNKLSTLQESKEDNNTTTHPEQKLQRVDVNREVADEGHVVASDFSMAKFNLTTCAYCNENFGTINLYNKHQCTVEEGKRYDDYSLNLLCFCCDATLNSCSQFDEHMRTAHNDRAHYCYLCPEKFSSKKLRNKHTNMQHDTSCRFCHMDIPLWMINLHEAYHLGFGYPCHKCKKAYSSKKNLSYHNTTIHKNGVDTMVFCNLCLKSVKLKSFRSHMHSHDSNKCHFCGKEFSDRTGIEYHTLIYHGGTFSKLKCNDCGTRFLTKRQLEQHRKTGRCGNVKRMKENNDTTKSDERC